MTQRIVDSLLKDALERKHKRLSFKTVYSHEIICEWLKIILPSWEIHIPQNGVSALSEWPASGIARSSVRKWLEEQNYLEPDDLIDGACEPLAFYLSSKMAQNHWVHQIPEQYKVIKEELEKCDPCDAAKEIFGEYIKHKIPNTTLFWGQEVTLGLPYQNYLFGHELAKERIRLLASASTLGKIVIPLYILCYIFDNDELSNEELKQAEEETAQYSLHVVGLVMDRTHRLLFVADPNGGLIPGSNMEFLEMPLQKRKPTTKYSCYDQSELERLKQPVFIGKPNGEIHISANAKKRAHTNDTMSPKEDGRKRYQREEISSSSSSSSSSSKTASEVAH